MSAGQTPTPMRPGLVTSPTESVCRAWSHRSISPPPGMPRQSQCWTDRYFETHYRAIVNPVSDTRGRVGSFSEDVLSERMHDLVIGLFINREEFGRAISHEINTSETSSSMETGIVGLRYLFPNHAHAPGRGPGISISSPLPY
jgi:hypothetical protein